MPGNRQHDSHAPYSPHYQSIRNIHRFWIMLHASRKAAASGKQEQAELEQHLALSKLKGGVTTDAESLSTFQLSDALKQVAEESARAQAA